MSSSGVDPHKIQPYGDFVVVELEPRKDRTESGLFLTHSETGVEKVREGAGHVVSVGPGKPFEKGPLMGQLAPMEVKPGDRVAFRRFLKDVIPLAKKNDLEYCMIRQDDLLGILAAGVETGPFSEGRNDDESH
jgi:co-chaperonin GroES (HSP10)